MAVNAPFAGAVVIADTSAWAHSGRPATIDAWRDALRGHQIATCSLVVFELLYGERDADAFRRRELDLDRLRDIPVTVSVQRAARAAMRELSEREPLHHRIRVPDLLIAAAAQEAGVGVLHYDHHYDRLAEVLAFDSRWLAPAGSL